MKQTARRGYMLTYLLAALPLFLAAFVVGTELLTRALRGQRIAIVQAGNDQEAPRLLRALQEDARQAEGVIVDGDTVQLTLPGATITYALGTTVHRVRTNGDGEILEQTQYTLRHATVSTRYEQLDSGRQLVWLIIDYQAKWEAKITDTWRLAAAARVGPEPSR